MRLTIPTTLLRMVCKLKMFRGPQEGL